MTAYNALEVESYFIGVSMENGEDFFVQYYDGSAWNTVADFATLSVFDVSGKRVATLVEATEGVGLHTVTFDAKGLSSGVYFYRLEAGDFVQQRKMVLLK